jgi:hypothetical protein
MHAGGSVPLSRKLQTAACLCDVGSGTESCVNLCITFRLLLIPKPPPVER